MGIVRFILACAVVLSHTSTIMGYSPVAGNLAVQCFYIISGFYMAMILTEKYHTPRSDYAFYTSRALRLYPIYWLNLLLLVVWALFVDSRHYPGTLDFYTKYAHPGIIALCYFILSNIFIVGLDWAFFLGIHPGGDLYFTTEFDAAKPSVYNFAFNSVGWTIGLEMLFYLVAPWLNKRTARVLVILFCLSLLLRIWLSITVSDGPQWGYMFFPTQLMLFIAGICSYRCYVRYIRDKSGRRLQYAVYTLLITVILLYYQVFPESYYKQAVLFLTVAAGMPFAFELTKKSKTDRFLGNLSYIVYISQVVVIKIVEIKKFPKLVDKGFTALLLVIPLALLINKFVGEPIEKYRAARALRLTKGGQAIGG
ncbi:MAG TPA: acyltransferase [Mucilaginibacter sp.]